MSIYFNALPRPIYRPRFASAGTNGSGSQQQAMANLANNILAARPIAVNDKLSNPALTHHQAKVKIPGIDAKEGSSVIVQQKENGQYKVTLTYQDTVTQQRYLVGYSVSPDQRRVLGSVRFIGGAADNFDLTPDFTQQQALTALCKAVVEA